MKIDDIARLVGQEIVSESKNGCVDVKYKHSCCSTYMRKNEYYLQLITGCDNYGKWFDMKYFTSIWLFLGSKGLIFWVLSQNFIFKIKRLKPLFVQSLL